MAKKNNKGAARILESILDLSAQNVWGTDAYQIAKLWEKEKNDEDFPKMEQKLLNTLRLAFEVVHFNPEDKKEEALYAQQNGEWTVIPSMINSSHMIAIRAKRITRLTDLTAQNIKFISAATLLELIHNNFGGGWEAIPANLREIIENAFDISTSQLPTSRIHVLGGSMERKLKAGFEVLEIAKGTWTEAIFARKKEEVDPGLYADTAEDTYDTDLIIDTDDDPYDDSEDRDDNDDTYYSQYASEAKPEDDLEDGMHIEENEELD